MGQPTDEHTNENHAALLALLNSVADELYAQVCEIVRLGESLSADELGGDRNRRICDLQTFDLLAQNALAQARLLKGIERELAEGGSQTISESIVMMIEDVPFHKARQRLYTAYVGGNDSKVGEMPWDGAGALDWF
jgi:hypothetical protein